MKNSKKGFSILDLLVKIIFAGLLIFIIVWLFNKKVPNMKPFYSNVFRENIKYMQDAGENYFTDDLMPTKVNETKRISLSELERKNMVIPFVDEDGKECDKDNSYVSIKKLEKGYELKTNLVCAKESNYIVKKLDCHTYCASGACTVIKNETVEEPEKECTTEKITQYEFKKCTTKTVNKYSCDNGYTLSGSKCTKTVVTDKTPSIKTGKTEKTETINATVSYTCPAGYTKENNKCVASSSSYVCEAGYTLNGNTCSKTVTTNTACPTGYTDNGNSCSKNIYGNITKTTTTKYANVIKTTTNTPYDCSTTERQCTTTYESRAYQCQCTSGVSGGLPYTQCSTCYESVPVETCHNVITKKTCYKQNVTYSCPSGTTQVGSGSTIKCSYKTESYACKEAGYTYTNGKCVKSVAVNKVCPAGYTLNGNTCSKVETKPATRTNSTTTINANVTYSCPTGYTKNGNVCTRTISTGSLIISCPVGYTLTSDKNYCEKYGTETKDAKKTAKDETSCEYTWRTSKTLSGWTSTGKTRVINGATTCKAVIEK